MMLYGYTHLDKMGPDELREHLDVAAGRVGSPLRSLAFDIIATCWPGGSHDRTERSALEWVRRWRPMRAATSYPVCSCASGHCAVCN